MANPHGPDNAEHELKKAYNCLIESGTTQYGFLKPIPGVDPGYVARFYEEGFRAYRKGDRLVAERWARTAKHLARAFWHEAKIAYLEPRTTDLPYLEGAREEYSLHEYSDTTDDLLESIAHHIPPGMKEMPKTMKEFLALGHKHLAALNDPRCTHELLRAEHTKAAHEYGRVLECIALAYEANIQRSGGVAA